MQVARCGIRDMARSKKNAAVTRRVSEAELREKPYIDRPSLTRRVTMRCCRCGIFFRTSHRRLFSVWSAQRRTASRNPHPASRNPHLATRISQHKTDNLFFNNGLVSWAEHGGVDKQALDRRVHGTEVWVVGKADHVALAHMPIDNVRRFRHQIQIGRPTESAR